MKDLYITKEDDGYNLCSGKPKPCKKYTTLGGSHYYTFGSCNGCFQISEDTLVNVSMNVGDSPIPVKIILVGVGDLKKEATKRLIRE